MLDKSNMGCLPSSAFFYVLQPDETFLGSFRTHDRDSGPKAMEFGRGSFVEMEWPYFFFLFIYYLSLIR